MLSAGFYNMDCLEAMREFPDKFWSLAVVDPPYGININMNMGRRKGEAKKHDEKAWDNSIPNDEYFKELFRVSENQIVWGGITSIFQRLRCGFTGINRCPKEFRFQTESLRGLRLIGR